MPQQGDLSLSFSFRDDGSVEVKRVIADVTESLRSTGAGARESGAGFDTMRGSVQRSVTDMDKLKGAMQQGAEAVRGFGIAWTIVGGFAFAAAKKVDDAMDAIRGKTGLTGIALKNLQNSFKAIATQVPADMRSVTQVMITLSQRAGLAGKDLETVALKAIKMAEVLGVDAVSAVSALSQAMLKWNVPMKDSPAYMDYLLKVSQQYDMSLTQLMGTMEYSASTMKELGLSFKEGAVLVSALEKAGVNSYMVFRMLTSSLKETARNGESMSETFRKVISEIKNATDATVADTLAQKYFGRVWMDVKKAIKEGTFEVEAMVKAIDASTESVDKAYRDTQDFIRLWGTFKNRLFIALEPVGKELMKMGDKYLPRIIEQVEKWAKKFEGLSAASKGLVAGMLAIGGPVGTWLNTLVNVFVNLGRIKLLVLGIAGAFTTVNGVTLMTRTAITECGIQGVKMLNVVGGVRLTMGTLVTAANLVSVAIAGWGLAAFAAGWKIGKMLEENVPIVKRWAENAGLVIAEALAPDTFRKAYGETPEYASSKAMTQQPFRTMGVSESLASTTTGAATEAALAERRMLMLKTASKLTGDEVTNVKTALDLLKKQFIETGTTGVASLDAVIGQSKTLYERIKTVIAGMGGPELAALQQKYLDFRDLLGTIPGAIELMLKKFLGDSPVVLFILEKIKKVMEGIASLSILPKVEKPDPKIQTIQMKDLGDKLGAVWTDESLKKADDYKKLLNDTASTSRMTADSLEKLRTAYAGVLVELNPANISQRVFLSLMTSGIQTIDKENITIKVLNATLVDLKKKYEGHNISLTEYTRLHAEAAGKLKGFGIIVQGLPASMEPLNQSIAEQKEALRATLEQHILFEAELAKTPGNEMLKEAVKTSGEQLDKLRLTLGDFGSDADKAWAQLRAGGFDLEKQAQGFSDVSNQVDVLNAAYLKTGSSVYKEKADELRTSLETLKLAMISVPPALSGLAPVFSLFAEVTERVRLSTEEQDKAVSESLLTREKLRMQMAAGSITEEIFAEGMNATATTLNKIHPGMVQYEKDLASIRQRHDLLSKTIQETNLKLLVDDFTRLAVAASGDVAQLKALQPLLVAIYEAEEKLGIKKPKIALVAAMKEAYGGFRAELQACLDAYVFTMNAFGMKIPPIILPEVDAKRLLKSVGEVQTKIQKGLAAVAGMLGMLFDNLATEMQDSFDIQAEMTGKAVTAGQQNSVLLVQGVSQGLEGLNTMFATLEPGVKASFGQILAAITPALGSIGAAIGGFISSTKRNFGKLGSDIGQTIGSIWGPVGAAVGAVVGGIIGGIFKKAKSQIENWVDDGIAAFKKLGDGVQKISDGLAKKFAELRAKGMAATAAEATLLSEAMAEMGVTTKNISQYWQESLNAISQVTAGLLTQEQAVEALGKDWDLLIGKAKEFGTEGSAAMIHFMKELDRSGTIVKSVQDYRLEQLATAEAGVKTLIENYIATQDAYIERFKLGKIPKGDLDRFKKGLEGYGKIAVEVFSGMIASGKSWTETLSAMEEPLTKLKEQYKKLGIDVPAFLQPMFDALDIKKKHPMIFQNLDAATAVLKSMRNAAYMSQETFDTLSHSAEKYAKAILGVKGNLNDFLKTHKLTNDQMNMLLPTITTFIGTAAAFGLGIPAWMKTTITKNLPNLDWDKFVQRAKDQADAGISTVEQLRLLNDKFKPGAAWLSVFGTGGAAGGSGGGGTGGDTGDRGKGSRRAQGGFEGLLPEDTMFQAHRGEFVKVWPASQVHQVHGSTVFPWVSGMPSPVPPGAYKSQDPQNISIIIEPVVIPKEGKTIIEFITKKIERGDIITPPRAIRGRA